MNNIEEDRDSDSYPSTISPLLSPGCYSRMCVSGKMPFLMQRKYKFVGENHLRPVTASHAIMAGHHALSISVKISGKK